MKALFKLHFDCGRQGTLNGIFIAEKEDVDILLAHEDIKIDFGEALGKYSNINGNLLLNDITFITDNKEVIDMFEKYEISSGYNPIKQMVTYNTCQKYFPNKDEASVREVIDLIRNTHNYEETM